MFPFNDKTEAYLYLFKNKLASYVERNVSRNASEVLDEQWAVYEWKQNK